MELHIMPAANVWASALAAFALIVIPSPSVLFVIGRSLSLGCKSGFLSVLGNAPRHAPRRRPRVPRGCIVAESIIAFTVIKLIGAAYLVYLGIQALRHRNDHTSTSPHGQDSTGLFPALREGLTVGVTNPKRIVFFVAVLPQFVDYDHGALPRPHRQQNISRSIGLAPFAPSPKESPPRQGIPHD
jgi:threonine/homoserine/homoserine lactone efflux protein